MKFIGQATLLRSTVVHNILILWIVVVLCFRHHDSPSTTEIVIVFDLHNAAFFVQVGFQVDNVTSLSITGTLGHFNVDNVHVKGFVQGELIVRLNYFFHSGQEAFGG
jgi:hypothetical protein